MHVANWVFTSQAVQFRWSRSGREVQFGPVSPLEMAIGMLPDCSPVVCARMNPVLLQCLPLSSQPASQNRAESELELWAPQWLHSPIWLRVWTSSSDKPF